MNLKKYISICVISFLFSACSSEIKKDDNRTLIKAKIEQSTVKVDKKDTDEQKQKLIAMEYSKQLELEKVKSKNIEKIEEIKALKEQKIKELEFGMQKNIAAEKTKQKEIENRSSIEIAKIEQNSTIATSEQKTSVYMSAIFFAGVICIIWIILSYYRRVAAQEHERELKEKELEQELYMKEMEIKQQNLNKMFDIVSNKDSDPAVKAEIVKFLSNSNNQNIIEHKEN